MTGILDVDLIEADMLESKGAHEIIASMPETFYGYGSWINSLIKKAEDVQSVNECIAKQKYPKSKT